MSNSTVSVIVPARNEQRLIGETLERILDAARQFNPTAVEVIVVDNASTDGTWETLQQFSVRDGVVAVCHQALGAARARNHGRGNATGEILVFVDADTWIESDCLRRIVDHCHRDGKEAGIIRLAGSDGGLRARVWWFFWEHVRRLPLPRAKAMPAVMFCTATVFDEYGPFDEEVAIGEEWPILAGLYRHRPDRFIYDRSMTAFSSSRRMEALPFGYLRTFVKYVWAILHKSGRIYYSDAIR
ncbi:glycosyltransferase family 2 protein [Schlesneria paludicola]|uniref:glycosyltransferase family 2 protein n=1 Tax=Schlesneria paludicola TaxID=360056 RepID=UPI000299F513|nr:glycosyltransferase family 2 protein [Schlesneria paludicola]